MTQRLNYYGQSPELSKKLYELGQAVMNRRVLPLSLHKTQVRI
jgi:hypothetical protein